jgi:hypothetical protein
MKEKMACIAFSVVNPNIIMNIMICVIQHVTFVMQKELHPIFMNTIALMLVFVVAMTAT